MIIFTGLNIQSDLWTEHHGNFCTFTGKRPSFCACLSVLSHLGPCWKILFPEDEPLGFNPLHFHRRDDTSGHIGEGQNVSFRHISIIGAEDSPDRKLAYLGKHALSAPHHVCPGEMKGLQL